ncbi:MAG: spore photoproduct lyase family protein [Candidatus Omnitrophota bacterium]
MTILENKCLARGIEAYLDKTFPLKLGVNKKNELIRLIYEISRGRGRSLDEVISNAGINRLVADGKNGLFRKVKKTLLEIRYPSLTPAREVRVMPLKTDGIRDEAPVWDLKLDPKVIFVEKDVRGTEPAKKIIRNFPAAKLTVINNINDVLRNTNRTDATSVYNTRRDNLVLIKNKSAFIKQCPCSAGCVRCGYMILNIGFGCPVDCAYCFLQTYSNIPGIVLPVNMGDYAGYITRLDGEVSQKTRIGTGEFTDSLALDNYTGYAAFLMPLFRKTANLVLELKTKTCKIDNVMKEDPHENVVISWSMNTRDMAQRYERGASGIGARIKAACEVAHRGYRVGFHFDPMICHDGWETDYRAIAEELFSHEEIRRRAAWISLGTLRYTPGLKQTAERRFSENLVFYRGEFFLDVCGKFRYPEEVRIDMYNKMARWIRSAGAGCWIYLCMEPANIYRKVTLECKKQM